MVATEVEVTFILHPSLEFVDEDDVSLGQETENSLQILYLIFGIEYNM